MNDLYQEYLNILKVQVRAPDFQYLNDLITAHLQHIPFENISKIYYKNKFGTADIPGFQEYLERVTTNNFGGTCYTLNYYFNQLLNHLGFNAILCSADMNNPDVHLVNIVKLSDREYLVDVGYAAPFFEPLPLDLNTAYEISYGFEKYVALPKDSSGYNQVQQFRYGLLRHFYIVKPYPRSISDFSHVINASFDPLAAFMNSILITKFERNHSIIINNFSLIEIHSRIPDKKLLFDKDELIYKIVELFKIPDEIVTQVVRSTVIS